jgi:RNA-directed DNA polymerase
MEGLAAWTPETGTPQGAVISPLLSNIYLNPLDHMMAERGTAMVRYADDLVLLCKSQEEALEALEVLRTWVIEHGLQLHPEKTRIVHVHDKGGFEFLGYRFERGRKFPRTKSLKKMRASIRKHTLRNNGNSLAVIIQLINPILRGWYQYFKHSYKTTFPSIDGWVRMRLRSILRKRRGGRGKGRGSDHQRWPNAFFTEQGLFSLTAAHAHECRSSPR